MTEMTEMQLSVLGSIQTIMVSTSLDDVFYTDVILRLSSLGYEVKTVDDWVLCFVMQKVEQKVKNTCNVLIIPDGLLKIAVDMVCGEFLFNQQQTGKLDASFDMDRAAKVVKIGDTSVELGGSGSTLSLDMLIKFLMGKEGDLICYRKLTW